MVDPETAAVRAAGGVVWRPGEDGAVEVAVVHRPRYDDWSLPKGKLEPGESWEDAALREVLEEIGARCELGRELSPVGYRDQHGRPKAVRYWVMRTSQVSFRPNDEVDELAWLAPEEAARRLTHDRDRQVVREAGL